MIHKMTTVFRPVAVFIFIFTMVSTQGFSQKTMKVDQIRFDTLTNYEVTLKDQTVFRGKYAGMEGDKLIFVNSASRFEVSKSQISGVKKASAAIQVNENGWFPNPHPTRYLFGPSAFNLKAREGYFQSIYGLANSVNFGVTDHFSMGAGTEIISLFSGEAVLGLFPKVGGFKLSQNLHAGAGSLIAITGEGKVGIGYGILTAGNLDHNVTFGAGTTFSSFSDISTSPILTISGMTRLSNKIALVSENWIFTFDGFYPVFSGGVRFFGENISVDLALIGIPDVIQEGIPIPYIDFVYKW